MDGTFEDYQRWDKWYVEQFMMERIEDPELVYEIYSEELIYRQKEKLAQVKMKSIPKRKFAFRTCWRYRWQECSVIC